MVDLCRFDDTGTCAVCGHVTPHGPPVYRVCGPVFEPRVAVPWDHNAWVPPRRRWWSRPRAGGAVADWIRPPPGLGDMVAGVLERVGITEDRVSRWIGRPCGCGARRTALNRWGWRVWSLVTRGRA